jgi:hypothetical protein
MMTLKMMKRIERGTLARKSKDSKSNKEGVLWNAIDCLALRSGSAEVGKCR